MISFDVVSLFTKISVDLAARVARNSLANDYSLKDRTALTVDEIVDLLDFCLKSTHFSFRGNVYLQRFGCAMGSPISTIVANLVMEHLEKRIFSNNMYDVCFWKRFVDDTWVLLNKDSVNDFFVFINSLEPSIKFTKENEDESHSITFLDVRVTRNNDFTFSTCVHRKATHTDRYLDFNSHHPLTHKLSAARTLHRRATRISSSPQTKEEEVSRLKQVLRSNNFPESSVRRFFKSLSNPRVPTGEQTTRVNAVIPYVRGCSERIARVLRRFDINTFFKPQNKLSTIFSLPKDPTPASATCGVVYEIPCADCSKVYVGQTANSLATRVEQHRAACRLLHPQKSAVAEHSITEAHRIDFNNARILCKETRWRHRLFLEACHTRSNQRITLNRCELPSADLYLPLLSRSSHSA